MKILLVDDQEISNFIMKKVIDVVLPDALVVEYTSPERALKALPDEEPDIIFLDLNMPEMSGWQFLKYMEDTAIASKVAIVTSSTSMADKEASKTHKNVIDFLIKPLHPADLGRVLQHL